jgi:sugar/nucleoside kinase (ribokinase family)
VCRRTPIAVLDGNLCPETLMWAAKECRARGVPVWFEPVSVPKAARAAAVGLLALCTYSSPNKEEALAMLQAATGSSSSSSSSSSGLSAEDVGARLVAECGLRHCVTTLGPNGVCVSSAGGLACHHQALRVNDSAIVNTNGAGDSLVGAVAAALCVSGTEVDSSTSGSEAAVLNDAIATRGLLAAKLCLETGDTISTALTPPRVPYPPVPTRLAAAL